MAIKMVQDDPDGNNKSKRSYRGGGSSSSGGGLGGGLIGLLINFLPYLLKRPKLLLIVAVIGVGLYFFAGKGCSADGLLNQGNLPFSLGGEMNKEIYNETEIFEPLADNKKNPLPEKVSLQKYCPTPMNQGVQGSCVAWASAYAARTIIEAQRTGQRPDDIKFSPSFMYNQISIDHKTCQGSYIKYAMDNMLEIGAVPFNSFRYNENNCTEKPSETLKQQASVYKIKGFQRLTDEKRGKVYEVLGMKQNLAKGSPIIIGMMVGGSFMQGMMGKEFWNPTTQDYYQQGFGGHAMCVVGYDDYYEGGSFLLMNSWGTDWGKNGFAWVRYSDFKEFNVEAYGLYPMGDAGKKTVTSFDGSFGLELNTGKKTIALNAISDHYFETTGKVKKTDKFKIEFTNNQECYTYVFGQENDGTISVLFPYTPKHSPYCGITGTRLFPSDYSMQPDEIGNKDKFAVLVTKQPIDYDAVKQQIGKANGATLEDKMESVFRSKTSNQLQLSGNETIRFSTEVNEKQVVYFVIGVNK
ncbi:peptidase C1 [Crocinitomicaceae bacterium CZZ-1]|uniref:Peptidase C1 n=1 Tax=Taishania pollutisoli TaxID=2766479 RepID=A0A8J6TTT3_9FLAO|nr:C1 family peptidase [Taishania pollutisoli]MBC9813612.1 peptidase C1 [Taishania pollutisoli]